MNKMKKVLTLDELAQQEVDVGEYGKKTAGLVKLHRILPSLKFPYPLSIPRMFAVPVNGLDSSNGLYEARDAYIKLTRFFMEPKIIFARSSDPEEAPGKFETHSSLYDPADPEKSFSRWLDAAEKVHESGAKALIAEVLAADLEDFPYDIEYIETGRDGKWVTGIKSEFVTIKSFGGSNSSFIGNSSSVMRGEYPGLVACFGLASKIARGDKDVSMMQECAHRVDVISLDHNYMRESRSNYEQKAIDLFTLENPDKITTLKYHEEAQIWLGVSTYNYASVPFPDHYFVGRGERSFNPSSLLTLISEIKSKVGKDVQVEGCVNEKGVNLFQLVEYDMPERNFKGLSDVHEDRLIIKTEEESIGFNQFKGDLYVSTKKIDVPKDAIFMYLGGFYGKDIEEFKQYPRLIIPFFESGGHYAQAHSTFHTFQKLVELEKIGVRAIALTDKYRDVLFKSPNEISQLLSKHPGRFEKIDECTLKYKNVTAECDGFDAQIYFN